MRYEFIVITSYHMSYQREIFQNIMFNVPKPCSLSIEGGAKVVQAKSNLLDSSKPENESIFNQTKDKIETHGCWILKILN